MVSFKLLRDSNTERQAAWPGANNIDLSFRVLELGGEAGEAQEVLTDLTELLLFSIRVGRLSQSAGESQNRVKKLVRELRGIRGNRTDNSDDLIQGIREELADMIICADLLAMDLDIDLGEAVKDKFNSISQKKDIPVFMNPEEPLREIINDD